MMATTTPQLAPARVPATAAPSAAPPVLDDRLPIFSQQEAQLNKVDNRNTLVFSVPAGSSLLINLVNAPCHAYEERDYRWLHLLQGLAVVPSRRVDAITKTASQALQLMRSPVHKRRLENALRGLIEVLAKPDSSLPFAKKALLALRLKDRVAGFLREWVKDPVEGYVLRKDHVVGGMRLDDVVATPVGAGYLRGYRHSDHFCIVVYPWGHGFVHRSHVEKLESAIEHERKRRRHNEYLALEHQHLYEQVESLLENHPPEPSTKESTVVTPDGVDWAEYKKILSELEAEHFDPDVVHGDLSFIRRVQALASKLHKRQRIAGDIDDSESAGDQDEAVEQSDAVMTRGKEEGEEDEETKELE